MNEIDLAFLRRAIAVSARARAKGNHPFGAILVDEAGQVLAEAENSVVTGRDCTGHAETNLMRQASGQYNLARLARCTVYTSAEPCPMCSGAIFWGNVRRVVYGLSLEPLYQIIGDHPENPSLWVHCQEIFSKAPWPIEILGPALEDEALEPHKGFW
jgi:tRNA(Arg) A34 adenosine deaminase TadA